MADDSTADAPQVLVDSNVLNGELVDLCTRFESALFDWMDRALAAQPSARHVPLKVAVSEVAFALADRLLYPTYMHFPELLPAHLAHPSAGAARH